jgi:hypothetical protein
VAYWIAGSTAPSGQYTDCKVQDRGNWSCIPTVNQARTITLAMAHDRATHGPEPMTVPFHAIPKWKWWVLRMGFSPFAEASY